MTRRVAIIQARATSTRLPGKVLLPLGPGTVLEEVLRRCACIPCIDAVCCAVPDGPDHDAVAAEAARCGAVVMRGSEHDVLDRYYRAAQTLAADVVMRVTSDCPLIDPTLCGEVLALVTGAVDYACNNMPASFPHGLDCEAFTMAALERAWREADTAPQREHVTPYLRTEAGFNRAALAGPGGAWAGRRWTLDHPDDYRMLVETFRMLPPPPAVPDWRQVAALLDAHPAIEAINHDQHQR